MRGTRDDGAVRRALRLRLAGYGSFLAVAGLAPIPLGYLLAGAGRGSETVILANILGPGLLLAAIGLGTQAFGILEVFRDRLPARSVAGVMIVDSIVVGVLGVILLVDRVPCTEGLYCSGQVQGDLGRLIIYLWFFALGPGYLVVGTSLLTESALRRSRLFSVGASLLVAGGLAFLLWPLALHSGSFTLLASVIMFLGWGLGPAGNAVLGAAFLRATRVLPEGARS